MPEVHENEVGQLHGLTEPEHLAVLTGMAMVARGEDVTPSVARQCVQALARLADVQLPEASDDPVRVITVGDLPSAADRGAGTQ